MNLSKRYPSFQDFFVETEDIQYAALAIGSNPEDPPEWAIKACVAYYEEHEVAVEPSAVGAKPKYGYEDGLLLDRVADLVVVDGLSLTAATKRVTDQESDGTDFRRLMRIWKRSMLTAGYVEGRGPVKTNKWLSRARRRKSYRQLLELLEIEQPDDRTA